MSEVSLNTPMGGDNPRIKESIIAQLYGEFIGFLKAEGLTDGKEFKGTVVPLFSCSKRYIHIWDNDETKNLQLVVYLCSTQFEIQFGVGSKNPKETIYKKELKNLRYKISNGEDWELIDSHQEKFKDFFNEFKDKFYELSSKKRNTSKGDSE